MKFAITTNRGLYIYDYDHDFATQIERGTVQHDDGVVAYAFGISWNADNLYVAWRRPDEIIEYDKELKPTGRVISCPAGPNALGDVHQILCSGGKIWVTNCGYNRIHAYDAKTLELVKNWDPSDGLDDDEMGKAEFHEGAYIGKYKHWNSIRIANDACYLLAHMDKCPPSKVWEFHWPTLKFQRKSPVGECCHNIFFHDGKINVFDSKNGKICEVNGKSYGFFDRSPFFRGVSQVGDKMFMGFSGQCLDARKRPFAPGGVVVLDRCDPMFYHVVFNAMGPVMEIRCLDEHDSAHDSDPFWKSV